MEFASTTLKMKTSSPSQAFDSMTDAEKVEFLAVKVMGYKMRNYTWRTTSNGIVEKCETCGSKEHTGHSSGWQKFTCTHCGSMEDIQGGFNPLVNWNHWRQVEMKIMEDDLLWGMFMDRIDPDAKKYDQVPSSESLMKADLPARARALYMAYHDMK